MNTNSSSDTTINKLDASSSTTDHITVNEVKHAIVSNISKDTEFKEALRTIAKKIKASNSADQRAIEELRQKDIPTSQLEETYIRYLEQRCRRSDDIFLQIYEAVFSFKYRETDSERALWNVIYEKHS